LFPHAPIDGAKGGIMSVKRLVLATSIVALAATGAAFAQNSGANSTPGVTGNSSVTGQHGANSGAMQNNGMSGSGSDMSGGSTSGSSSGMSSRSNRSMSSSNASQSDVMRAQQALKDKGLYNGQVDGKIGPETRTAISQFQRQNGLKQSAQLDQQTLGDLSNGGGVNNSGSTRGNSSGAAGSRDSVPGNTPGASGSTGGGSGASSGGLNGSGATNGGMPPR
jgi:peptidoglycan hydrolase-like protein with peptidoglycan-binding domain